MPIRIPPVVRFGVVLATITVIALGWPASIAPRSAASIRPVTQMRPGGATQIGGPAQERAYDKLPLSFEVNRGQTDHRVQFLAHGHGYTLFLTGADAVFAVRPASGSFALTSRAGLRTPSAPNASAAGATIHLHFVGATARPHTVGRDRLPGLANYFIGNNPHRWHTAIPTYARVQVQNLYRGIDTVYYGNAGQVEYDLIAHPGADLHAVRLRIEGAGPLHLDRTGNLLLGAGPNQMRFAKPLLYQTINGTRRPVGGGYRLLPDGMVTLTVGAYDRSRSLVIDPAVTLAYSSYLGGSANDFGQGIAIDHSGDAYVAGYTNSSDFPTCPGNRPTPGSDPCTDVSISDSAEQPSSGGGQDAFVSELNASGTALVYSTYLGGSGDDQAFGIAVEGTGTVAGTGGVNSSCSASCTAYVTGFTPSGNFPTVPTSSGKCAALQCAPAGSGVTNAFVTAIAPGGQSLTYSTYLGGTGGPGGGENATGAAIAVDTHGDAYVTGGTYSQDFPTCPTTNPNTSSSVTPDACATTTGTTLQTAPNPNGSLAYVSKLNATGTALIYSTYLGGTGTEQFSNGGTGITVDANGEAFVVGSEASLNFPTCPTPNPINDPNVSAPPSDACDTSNTTTTLQTLLSVPYTVDNSTNPPAIVSSSCHLFCSPDVFVAELTPDGSKLIYSTYLGGGEDNSFGGSTDTGDSVVVRGTGGADTTCAASCDAYITGYTYADDFPTCPDQNPNTPSTGTPPPDACDSSNKGSTLQAADKTGESGTGFVSELNPTGSQLVYSTYLGGSTSDYATGIGVDNSGDAYVFGDTESTDFPICANTTPTDPCASNAATPPQPSFGGGTFDAFVSELAPSGSNLVYSTYLGGSGDEETNGVGGNNLAVDASGNAYVTGMTTSTDFPTCPTQHSAGQAATCTSSTPTVTCTTTPLSLGAGGTLQCSNAGGQDAFVSKLASSSPTAVRVVSFGAQRQGADVVFHWRLAMTSGIAGFNLYARHHRLTPHTIPLRVSRNYRYTIRWKGHGPYSLSVLLKSGQSFTVTT